LFGTAEEKDSKEERAQRVKEVKDLSDGRTCLHYMTNILYSNIHGKPITQWIR
jgi:hypothetical protein